MTMLEAIPPLSPLSFYGIFASIKKAPEFSLKVSKVPFIGSVAKLLGEEPFGQVGLLYHKEGLIAHVRVNKSFEDCFFPDVAKGDGIEFFIDTRNLKQHPSVHQFCHHFVILPKDKDGIQFAEVTRMRLEDSHPIASGQEVKIESSFAAHSYDLKILLPHTILHGYDLDSARSIGFAYRLHRYKGKAQHFPISLDIGKVERHPSLWATLHLEE